MLPTFLIAPISTLIALNTVCKHIAPSSYHHFSFTFYSSFLLTPAFVTHLVNRILYPFDTPDVFEEVVLVVTYITLSFVYTCAYCRQRPNPTTLVLYSLILLHELALGVQNTPIHRFVLVLCAFGNFKHYLTWLQAYKPTVANGGWNFFTWSTWFSCLLTLLVDFTTRTHTIYHFVLLATLPWTVPLDQEMTMNHLEYGKSPLLIAAPVEIFKDFTPSSRLEDIKQATPLTTEELEEQDLIQFD